MLAVGGSRGVQLWNLATGEPEGHWSIGNEHCRNNVGGVVFSPDGTKLAAYNHGARQYRQEYRYEIDRESWTIWLLDLETGEVVQVEHE